MLQSYENIKLERVGTLISVVDGNSSQLERERLMKEEMRGRLKESGRKTLW